MTTSMPEASNKRKVIDMEHADKRFSKEEESLLKRIKGSRLLAIDAVLAAPPDNSWNTVRLHFDNFDLDINNSLHDIVVDELGTLEEFGLLSIAKTTKKTLEIPEVGADTSTFGQATHLIPHSRESPLLKIRKDPACAHTCGVLPSKAFRAGYDRAARSCEALSKPRLRK